MALVLFNPSNPDAKVCFTQSSFVDSPNRTRAPTSSSVCCGIIGTHCPSDVGLDSSMLGCRGSKSSENKA